VPEVLKKQLAPGSRSRHREAPPADWEAFARFPTWMWRNAEMHAIVIWPMTVTQPACG
jgi:hypothetical protein